MLRPLCGVASQTIIGSFGRDSAHKNVFIGELCCSCVGGIIDGYSNGYNDGLLTIVVAIEGIGFNNNLLNDIYFPLIIGGLTTTINEFSCLVNGYLNCFNAEREREIAFDTSIPLRTSNSIVLKFFGEKEDLNVIQRCDDISMTNTKQKIVMKVYLIIFLNEKEQELIIFWRCLVLFFCFCFMRMKLCKFG